MSKGKGILVKCYVDDLHVMAENISIRSMIKTRLAQLLSANGFSEAVNYPEIRTVHENDNPVTVLAQILMEKLVDKIGLPETSVSRVVRDAGEDLCISTK